MPQLICTKRETSKQQTRLLCIDPTPYCGEGGSTELMVLKGLSLYASYSKLRPYLLRDLGQMTQPPSASGCLLSRVYTFTLLSSRQELKVRQNNLEAKGGPADLPVMR